MDQLTLAVELPANHFRQVLDRVLEEADRIADAYSNAEETMHRQIIDGRRGFSAAEAKQYADYAAAARVITAVLHKTAMQNL